MCPEEGIFDCISPLRLNKSSVSAGNSKKTVVFDR